MTGYPYPGDSPVARARRVAQAYRHIALAADPDTTLALDARVTDWGEGWVAPQAVTYADGALLTAAQAAEILCVEADTIGQLRRRGRLSGYHVSGRGFLYLAGDVYQLMSTRRRASPDPTDRITANGTTVPTAGSVRR